MLFGNSVQEYYLSEVRKIYAARKARLAAIKTKAQARAYVKEVREKIRNAFALPSGKSPLNARITGEERKDGLVMKKVIYESRPSYPVTALLFMREDLKKKAPAVLFLCGHSLEGKGSPTYQTCCINLAKQGYIVLSVDPVSQGERHQFLTVKGKFNPDKSPTQEHNYMGKQLYLAGEFLGSWRAWDAVRGLDYLLTLPEVDPARVGVTGNSGGGTMTTFVNALEDRFAMAAPSCYVTTWLHEVENELPADAEQMPPGMLAQGLDMSDFVIARAPRPTLLLGQKDDFFDPRGTREAWEDARHIYKLLGAEDSVQCFIGPHPHGYSQPNREAMYKFFAAHTPGIKKNPAEDGSLTPFEAQATWCTPKGEVEYLKGNRHLRDLLGDQVDLLLAKRKKLSPKALKAKLLDILQIGEITAPFYRKLRPNRSTETSSWHSRFGLETEEGRVMSVLKCYDTPSHNFIPDEGNAVLYIPHLDSNSEIGKVKCPKGDHLLALDVRGVGEVMPSGCDFYSRDFFGQYLFDYHYMSLGYMYDRPYLGGKVRDILCAVKLLKECGIQKITLAADGQGTVPALLAAVLCDTDLELRLTHAPESWESMVRKPITRWPMSAMLPGILSVTDLDKLRSMVKDCKVTFAKEPAEG